MSIRNLQLLRNIGQFDSVDVGAQLGFTKLTLIYAENSRGKTTLASIMRSVSTNDPRLLTERQRLGALHPPHIVLGMANDGPIVFENGAWSASLPNVSVFDDAFVAANVCSGIEIESRHRQNLHELILGTEGVALNATLQQHIARIEQHNRDLRQCEAVIPAATRGTLSVNDFCGLKPEPDIETAIAAAERNLAAAKSADGIQQRAPFAEIALPGFDRADLDLLLGRTLPDLEAEAVARVGEHLRSLGRGGEEWAGSGMDRIDGASAGQGHAVCPFCAQDLEGSPLIRHYTAYFSQAYKDQKTAIDNAINDIQTTHGGDVPAAFERSIRVASQAREFWRAFIDVRDLDVDTAAIARDWNAARDAVVDALRAKAAAPLEAMVLTPDNIALIDAFHAQRDKIARLSADFHARNAAIAVVKEQAAAANVAAAQADLTRLQVVRARFVEETATACQAYLDEKAAKEATENARDQARNALDDYRGNVFPAYQNVINEYLQRFNAGFRLGAVNSVNHRGGSACTYNVIINDVPVQLTAQAGPAFRNTLSAGDRNTLALAFFFASLEHDPQLTDKIVVIDDPMTSLDEHRSLTTLQEMRLLQDRVNQVIVLSHSKPFLCALWEGADEGDRSAYIIRRDGASSTLATWDVRQDCITEHDRRHEMLRGYVQAEDPALQRQIASALRPTLEAFMRVAYPSVFPPGALLGHFIGVCQQRLGTADQILDLADTTELRALLDYANLFHHDTNPAWETAAINDQQLLNNCERVLAFTRRS